MIQTGTFWLVVFGSAVVYWLLPRPLRLGFLALASYFYLASIDPVGVTVLIGWTVLFFYVAPATVRDRDKAGMVLSALVVAILGYLIWQKYLPAVLDLMGRASPGVAVAVPLGISYFTFKLIHYAVETARGNIKDRSLPQFFCYIFLFPIFTAGPIERFEHFRANIADRFEAQTAAEGLIRIGHGLIKIFLIAQLVQPSHFGMGVPPTASALLEQADGIPVWRTWAFLILTYLYAYLDFSAYSDIAIGTSRLFGIRIMENFRLPVLAQNITDFWKRWHMTLAAWCQSYVYMPVLARTRMPYAAVYATFIAMGLWHGATGGWFLWGVYHASGVAGYTMWARRMRGRPWWRKAQGSLWKHMGIPLTFLFVAGSYAFSSAPEGAWSGIRIFLLALGIRT